MPGRTRRLVLLRHAKAEPSGSVADELRRLSAVGTRQATAVGAALRASALVPEHVLVSAAVRTRETWQHVAAGLGDEPEPEVVVSDALYLASVSEVHELVRDTDARVRTLLVVGHEPAMSAVASLLAGPDDPALAQVRGGLSTAAYAVLELVGPWADLTRRSAVLRDVVRPAWTD